MPSGEPNNIAPQVIEPKDTGLKTNAPKNIAPIMFGLMLSLFLANLDQTIVATCLSAIAHDLSGWELLPWIISAYLVTSTATTPIYGRLSDLYGRRLVLLTSIVIFVLASALCALANTMPLLIAARVLQGIGGGGLRSITQVVIADIIPPRNRGKYQGYMSTTFLISTALGPVLGGFFAEHLSWQWAFWINLPLGAIAFVVINKQLRALKIPTKRQSIDWAGAILILAAAVPLLFGISQVEEAGGWLNQHVLVPIALGLAATAVLIFVELRVASPMLPMRLFSNKIFTLGNIALFAPSMVMTALIIIIPLYYQIVLKRSADTAGLQLIALTGGMAVGSFIVGSCIAKFGRARIFPIIGALVAAGVCLLIAREGFGPSIAFDVTCTILLGASLGWQINPLLVIVQNGLEIRDIGTGVSGMTFFRSLAGAFGVAMFSTFLIASLSAGAMRVPGYEKLGSNPGIGLLRSDIASLFGVDQQTAFQTVLENAFSSVFVLSAALCLVTALVVAIIPARKLRADSGRL